MGIGRELSRHNATLPIERTERGKHDGIADGQAESAEKHLMKGLEKMNLRKRFNSQEEAREHIRQVNRNKAPHGLKYCSALDYLKLTPSQASALIK